MKSLIWLASATVISFVALIVLVIRGPELNESLCTSTIRKYHDNQEQEWPNPPELSKLRDRCTKQFESVRALADVRVLEQMKKADRCKPHQTLSECMHLE